MTISMFYRVAGERDLACFQYLLHAIHILKGTRIGLLTHLVMFDSLQLTKDYSDLLFCCVLC